MDYLPESSFDKYRCIVQRDGDGGDSLQRHGYYHLGRITHFTSFEQHINIITYSSILDNNFIDSSGKYRRHPVQWSGDPVSRDQMIPNIAFMGLYPTIFENKLYKIYNQLKSNYFRFDNGDVVNPEILSMFIRKNSKMYHLPLLWLADFTTLVNSLICIIRGYFDNNFTDLDVNHTAILCFNHYTKHTFLSKLAIWMYFRFRPVVKVVDDLDKVSGPQSALDWYFHKNNGGQPLNEVWKKTLINIRGDVKYL